MTRDDDPRENDDTTIIAGGQQAWSTAGPQGEPQPPLAGDPPPDEFAGPRRRPRPAPAADSPAPGRTRTTGTSGSTSAGNGTARNAAAATGTARTGWTAMDQASTRSLNAGTPGRSGRYRAARQRTGGAHLRPRDGG